MEGSRELTEGWGSLTVEGSRELTVGWGESNSGGVQGADWRLG